MLNFIQCVYQKSSSDETADIIHMTFYYRLQKETFLYSVGLSYKSDSLEVSDMMQF